MAYQMWNDVPNGTRNHADTWKSDSSLYPVITEGQMSIFKEKIEGTWQATNIKPTVPNVS